MKRILFVLLLIPLGFLSGSCDSKTETTYNFGSKSTFDDFISAVFDAALTTNYDSGTPGDWVAIENTQKVPGGTPLAVGYNDYSVLSRVDSETDLTIRFLKEQFDADRVKEVESAFDVVLQKAQSQGLKVTSLDPMKISAKSVQLMQTSTEFYNVKRYAKKIDAPREIRGTDNCAGFPDCKIQTEVVEFDLVNVNKEEDEVSIVNYKIYYSGDLPGYWSTDVLGLVLSNPAFPGHAKACLYTIIDQNGNDQPVELCETVVDFLPLPTP